MVNEIKIKALKIKRLPKVARFTINNKNIFYLKNKFYQSKLALKK